MKIVAIHEASVPISRYADPALPSGGLTTSIVCIATDAVRGGRPVTGYGFASIGRFAQGGLIRERFAPRLMAAGAALATDDGSNLDPFKAWAAMMAGEKPGGHGERCVAVGTLDMAIWDAAAKIAGLPLNRFLARTLGTVPADRVPVYAGGGYYYPAGDRTRLTDEIRRMADTGFTAAKIKIGGTTLSDDLRRIEAAQAALPAGGRLAVDAMNGYDRTSGIAAAQALSGRGLWWFEDVCDPLDFDAQTAIAATFDGAIAAGEALFSLAEAKLLDRHGGLRRDRDILLFDPVHCYGLPGYLQILRHMEACGWTRERFWPHGGHLFALHMVSGLALGGAEINAFCFPPFGGLAEGCEIRNGMAAPPDLPGIGFEARPALAAMFRNLDPMRR
ncbi:MAG: enolase C-terminal domain-like protein [Alphaproteobacteria bacterium]